MQAQQHGQRFEVEAAIDEQLGLGKLWRQVKLSPKLPGSIGEHRLGVLLVAMQLPCQVKHALQICLGAAAIFVILRQLTHGIADQVLSLDGLLSMRPVLRRVRLEVEAQGAVVIFLKPDLTQLTDIVAGDHLAGS